MDFLKSVLALLKTGVDFLYSAVTGAINVVLSEVPDDEIAIMHGAMALVAQKMHDGATAEETWTAVLNYVAASEKQEVGKVTEHFLQAFIHGLDAKRAAG
jgi:hypothetical protein